MTLLQIKQHGYIFFRAWRAKILSILHIRPKRNMLWSMISQTTLVHYIQQWSSFGNNKKKCGLRLTSSIRRIKEFFLISKQFQVIVRIHQLEYKEILLRKKSLIFFLKFQVPLDKFQFKHLIKVKHSQDVNTLQSTGLPLRWASAAATGVAHQH